ILGFLVVYWSTDSPPGSQTDPEQVLERITTHIRSHRFEEALRELEEASLDDNTTDKLRAEAVDAWLKDLGLPNKENAERLVKELARLRILVAKQKTLLPEPDNRYAEAVALYIPARAKELTQKEDFEGALRVLKTEGF